MATNIPSDEPQPEPEKKRRGRPPQLGKARSQTERTKSYRDRLNEKAARESEGGLFREKVQLNAVVDGQTRERLKMCAKQNHLTIGELLDRLVEKSDLASIFG